MQARKHFIYAVLAIGFFLLAAWLLPPSSDAASKRPLRIGYPPWIAYDVLLHAERSGMFERHGVEVELIRFDETSDVARAVMNGGLDAGFTGLATLIVNHDGTPLEVVFFTDISNGADGIVARPGISTVGDLRGKRIGCKLRATNRLILAEALSHHGVSMDEITVVDVSNEAAERMLASGTLDAAVLWEPDLSALAERIAGEVVYRTSDIESVVLDTLVARSDLASSRSADFAAIREVWFELLETIETDPEPVFETVSSALRQEPAVLHRSWGGIIPADRSLNRRLLEDRFEHSLRVIAGFMQHPVPTKIRPSSVPVDREAAR